jgi:hypothetical protein
MKAATLSRLQAERAAKRPVVLLTRLSDGAQMLWPGDEMPAELVEASKAALGSEEAGNVTLGMKPGSSIRITRLCALLLSVPCISPRPWRPWPHRLALPWW